MNVALLLSGLPRFYIYSYPHIYNKIIKIVTPDIYIYTTCDNGTKQSLINTYHPYNIYAENADPPIQIPNGIIAPETPFHNIYHMFRQRYECYKLLQNHYDWIILTRFDVIINREINLSLLNTLNSDQYHVPIGGNFRNGVNDVFVLSNQINIKHYCDLYTKVKRYMEDEHIMFHPESMLKYHLDKSNKTINRINMIASFIRQIENNQIVEAPHGLDCM